MPKKLICSHGLVTDRWVSLDPADMDFIEAVYKRNLREGEERLALAVLESAVEDFQKHVLSKDGKERKLFQEAEVWFLEKDSRALFSFESICETLQLHPHYIRQGLLLWKEAKIKTSSAQDNRAGHPKLTRSRAKHRSVRLSKTAILSPMPQLQQDLAFRA
jgi:hypothetical protein